MIKVDRVDRLSTRFGFGSAQNLVRDNTQDYGRRLIAKSKHSVRHLFPADR